MVDVETKPVSVEAEIVALVALAMSSPDAVPGSLMAGSALEAENFARWRSRVRASLGVCRQRAKSRMHHGIVEAVAAQMADYG